MSGPGNHGNQDQPNYANPADFFNNGAQQENSGHSFFDQQHNQQQQQQNWHQQPQQAGEMPATSEPSNPPGGAPMFYNPADYSKGAVNQPSFFNPYQDQPPPQQQQQGGTEQQQQQPDNQQQVDVSRQQYQGDSNLHNQWPQQDNQWNYQQQHDPNFNYSDGNVPHDQSQQNFPPYGQQQPFYSQQSNDSAHGNGDYGPPQNQWNQGGPATEKEWSDPNNQSQGENNVANVEQQETKQGNVQVIENDEEDTGGYLGLFHNDDNESDFLESNKTSPESPEQANQQSIPVTSPPRTSNEIEGAIQHDAHLPGATGEGLDPMALPFQPGQPPPSQDEVPQGIFTPTTQMDVINSGGSFPDFPGEQPQEGRTDNSLNQPFASDTNLQPNLQHQPYFQPHGASDGHVQSEFTPPHIISPQESLTNQVNEEDSVRGGSDVGPPSEHSSIAGSLPPSEQSASSTTTSRSNSMLDDSGSNVPPTAISSQESVVPAEANTEFNEQSENRTAPLDVKPPHVGDGIQTSVPPVYQMQPTDNLPAQNVQVLSPPTSTMDISRQNSAVSNVSNVSVPSTTDTNISSSSLAESEQQVNSNEAALRNSNDLLLAGGSAPPPVSAPVSAPAPSKTLPHVQDNGVLQPDISQMPVTTPPQASIQPVPRPNKLNTSNMPPPAPPAHSQTNPQPVTQLPAASPASSAPPVSSHPGTQSTDPVVPGSPLLSGAAHPSAFRTVRSQHNRTPTSAAAVNPSPPLWSTEVPSLPSNILLAPAAVPSSTASSATTPSLAQPVKLDKNLAASIASVPVPPPPSEVNSFLNQTPGTEPSTAHPVPNQTVPSEQSVNQMTQQMSGLSVGQVAQPTLLPPASAAAQHPPTAPSVGGAPPYVPALSQPSSIPAQQVATASTSAPALPNPNQPVTPVHPVAVLPGGQPVVSSAQDPNQSQQQQQGPPGSQYPPNQQQAAPGQDQWYGGRGQNPSYSGYPSHPYHPQDYRSQYEYDQYYHGKHQHQSSYSNRERPYSRQGYESQSQDRSYRERDPMRPYSRQGYEHERERPRSRQGKEYDAYNAYYRGYNRRDPRYADYDEYYRRSDNRGYDPRYEEWYRKRYYQQQQQQQGNRSRGGYDHNTSGLDQSTSSQDDSRSKNTNTSTDAMDGSNDRSRFAVDFHHQGGDTPEKYGPNMSGIEQASPGYRGDYSRGDSYSNRGEYDYNYDDHHRRSYDNGYSSTDGSWGHGHGYADYSYPQPAKPAVYNETRNGSFGQGYDEYAYQQPPKPATPPPPERLTPCKFNRPHLVCRFSSGGQLIKVLPNTPADGQPAMVEIHSIESMLEHNEEYSELKSFPGPLTRVHSHKNDVVRFAIQKAEDCRKNHNITDKESAALLWDLMVLLCRQNGTIVGTDISELLLRDHPMTSKHRPASPPPPPVAPAEEEETKGDEEGEDGNEGEEAASAARKESLPQLVQQQKKTGPDIEKETHRFRELLLFGRKKEALESAIKGALWGHALLLACKMDHRTHLSVMTRFANSLPMNDPLQTLYQLMSNRQPAAVTSCSDEKWGDWRPHLAMILSNLIENADLDVKSITSLGDSLASRSLLHASHFCYLMAQIGLGTYSKKATKMVLLGTSHSLPFKDFLRRDPIQQTEVYEYAQSLANKRYALPTFQVYKFIYATQLLDYGFVTQALQYCEVIATTIQALPTYYAPELITQVSELAHRLKYHDHQYFDGREITEPDWLRELDQIKIQYEEGALQPSSVSDTPMPWVESYTNLSTMGESIGSEGMSFEVSRTGQPRRVDTPHSEEIGLGSSASQDGRPDQQYGGQDGTGGYAINQTGYYQPTDGTNANYPAGQMPQQVTSGYDWGNQQQQQQQQYPPVSTTDAMQTYGDQQQHQMSGNYAPFQPSDNHDSNAKPQNLDLAASANSNFSEYSTTSATTTTGESATDTDLGESNASQAFDYYGMSANMPNQGNGYVGMGNEPSPTGTMTPPDTPVNRTRTRTLSGSSSQMTPTPQQQTPTPRPAEKPKEKKKENKPQKKSWFKGWFGGNKEMHLPDDKDKTIQWDEEKKKWVNMVDGEEESSAPPPPPPKDADISGAPPGSAAPGTTSAPSMGPPTSVPPGVNKFSRKAGGRGNYVDVFNQGSTMHAKPSSLPPPSKIFETLPATNAMPTNFFVPQGGTVDPAEEAGAMQPQVGNPESRAETPASSRSRQNSGAQQLTPQATQQPQFFNPNSFGTSAGYQDQQQQQQQYQDQQHQQQQYQDQQQQHQYQDQQQQQQQQESNLSRSSSMSSLSQEVSTINQQQQEEQAAAPPPGPAPVTNPMMFNPQAFSQPAAYPAQPAAGRRGYGQRRQYPTQR